MEKQLVQSNTDVVTTHRLENCEIPTICKFDNIAKCCMEARHLSKAHSQSPGPFQVINSTLYQTFPTRSLGY